MFKNFKNKKTYMIATSIVLMATLFAARSEAGYVEPGSESDPVVSKTYVDKKISDLKDHFDIKLQETSKEIESIKNNTNKNEAVQTTSQTFKVLELKKGETLIAGESTEIIVRSGVVHAIGSINGGLSDITEGVDLQTGQLVKPNHLIIIPRSDDRGIEVKSNDTFVMIKGSYKIKK